MRDRGLVTVHRYIWSGGRRTLARRSRASALSILILALATIGSLAASAAESPPCRVPATRDTSRVVSRGDAFR